MQFCFSLSFYVYNNYVFSSRYFCEYYKQIRRPNVSKIGISLQKEIVTHHQLYVACLRERNPNYVFFAVKM